MGACETPLQHDVTADTFCFSVVAKRQRVQQKSCFPAVQHAAFEAETVVKRSSKR
jgi:hypothetical protein